MDARDVRGGKRIRVQGAQAVFRQAILRVKTRRSRARLLAASPVSRRCLALGKSAGCKCGGYRGRKLTAPHAKGCGGKATHRPPDVNLRPRAGTFRRNPSQTERTVTPKSDATRTAHSPSPDYISPSHPRLCHIITFQRNKIAPNRLKCASSISKINGPRDGTRRPRPLNCGIQVSIYTTCAPLPRRWLVFHALETEIAHLARAGLGDR